MTIQGNGRDTTILEYARLKSRERLRHAHNENLDPNPLDVIVVGQEQWEHTVQTLLLPSTIEESVRATLTLTADEGIGPKALLRKHGAATGVGVGGGAILVSLFNMMGRILSS